MCGFGGAGAFSDGKYNITNDFGGTLYEHIGKSQAIELMKYVDDINMEYGGQGTKLYSTAGTKFKKLCLQNKLNLLDASVRHLGTDINYIVLENLYNAMKDHVDFYFDTPVQKLEILEDGYRVICEKGTYDCKKCIVSVGRSGSKWMETVCKDLNIPTKSNRVDIGVRVELPAVIFSHLTDELYESKIVYRTEKFEDNVRTFCMNPNGIVVNENTNGIITVNGHSYEGDEKKTDNTNLHFLFPNISPSHLRTVTDTAKASQDFQHAWRRCYRTAFWRSCTWTKKYSETCGRGTRKTNSYRDTWRFESGTSEAYSGWHYRDDLCTGQSCTGNCK